MSTRASGKKIKLTGRALTSTSQGPLIKGSGSTISSTASASRSGKTEPITKENTGLGGSTARASSYGLTAPRSRETSSPMGSKGGAFTAGSTAENTRASGPRIKCTASGLLNGRTGVYIEEIMLWMRKKATECLSGQMGGGMREIGTMEFSTEKGCL